MDNNLKRNKLPGNEPGPPILRGLDDGKAHHTDNTMSLRNAQSTSSSSSWSSMASDAAEDKDKRFYDVVVRAGRGLIIVNTKFEGELSDRNVNHDYIHEVRRLLEERKVHCEVHWDQTAAQMLKTIDDFSTEDLTVKEHLAFAIVVSHGAFGTVFGTDGVPVTIMQITERFSQTVRPSLSLAAKVFIVQSCQTFQDYTDVISGSLSLSQEEVIPLKENNFHVEYTTLPGGFDFDLSKSGSIYFYHFNRALEKHSGQRSLQDILQNTRKKLQEQKIPYQGKGYNMCSLSLSTLQFPFHLWMDGPSRWSSKGSISNDELPTRNCQFCPEEYDFYHGYLTATTQVKLVVDPYRHEPGHFLLRPSFSDQAKFTFVITHSRQRLLYLKLHITKTSGSQSFSLGGRDFSSLKNLVSFYCIHSIPNDIKLCAVFLHHPIKRGGS